MQKDFDGWNTQKKRIDQDRSVKLYHEGEIWWCALGMNVGSEQNGGDLRWERPVLVIKGFSPGTCLVAPLTASGKINRYRIDIGRPQDKRSFALISQIRVMDTRRFTEMVGCLDSERFSDVRKAVRDLF